MSYSDKIDQFKELQSALEKLHGDVTKELKTIRSEKLEIQQLKQQLKLELQECRYMREEGRLIISAPDIVIGNVAPNGALMGGGSRITLRGEDISIEGVGADSISGGMVTTRASSIMNIAVDPGIDGVENVVKGCSSITNIARSVVLQSENATDNFHFPYVGGGSGVDIISDTMINVEAAAGCTTSSDALSSEKSSLSSLKSDLTSECSSLKSSISSTIADLNTILMSQLSVIDVSNFTLLTMNEDYKYAQMEFESISGVLSGLMDDYFYSASQLAEVNRQLTSIDDKDSELSSMKSTFTTKDIGNQINLTSESIALLSQDGDGNIRETPSSNVSINTKFVNITTQDKDQKQIVDGSITMLSPLVELSTANPNITDSSSEFPAEGDVKIISKRISMEAVDYQTKDDKCEESLLTKEGSITMRASTIKADTTSTDGTNDGMMLLNAKRMEIKSMDVDKDSRKDKSLTSGGEMLLNSEKLYVGGCGSTTESENSTLLQLVSSEVGVFGSTTLELQQGKAIVQLTGDKLSVSGQSTDIYGTTTLQDDVTVSGALSGGKGEFKTMDVSTVLTGPSLTDGVGAAPAGGGGSLSAKIKQEEIAATPEPK